jgi:hypothetical protein
MLLTREDSSITESAKPALRGASARDPIAIDKGVAQGFHAYHSRAEFYDAIDKQQFRDVLVFPRKPGFRRLRIGRWVRVATLVFVPTLGSLEPT